MLAAACSTRFDLVLDENLATQDFGLGPQIGCSPSGSNHQNVVYGVRLADGVWLSGPNLVGESGPRLRFSFCQQHSRTSLPSVIIRARQDVTAHTFQE